ncbi:hypothetical protein ABPG75_012256 [Micractinium tetrahymenae]
MVAAYTFILRLTASCASVCTGIGWGIGGYARLPMLSGGDGPCNMYMYGVLAPLETARYIRPQPPPQPPPRPPPPATPPLASRPSPPPSAPSAPVITSLPDVSLVACDASGQVAAAASGAYIYLSKDGGRSWTRCTGAGAKYWSSLAVSGNGRLLLATSYDDRIVDGTTSNVLSTSTDCITWTASTVPGIGPLYITVASYTGRRLAATGAGSKIFVSWNLGATWAARAGKREWFALASSADGTRLAATVYPRGRNASIVTSNDTLAFVDRFSYVSWISIASSSDGLTRLASSIGNPLL